jgi:IS30 family transposase
VKYKPPQPQSYSAETAALITQLKDHIKRLEEAGVELRECASQLGWTSSDDSRWIKRAESAVKAWDKEAKL